MRKIILSLLLIITIGMLLSACTTHRTMNVKVPPKQESSPVPTPTTNIQPQVEQEPIDTATVTAAPEEEQSEEKPITTVNAPIDDTNKRNLPISRQEIDSLKQGIEGITVDNPTGLSK